MLSQDIKGRFNINLVDRCLFNFTLIDDDRVQN